MSSLDLLDQSDVAEMFGTKLSRWFQRQSVSDLRDIFQANPIARVLLKQPTGCGKTVTSGMCVSDPVIHKLLVPTLDSKGRRRPMRVLFLSHLRRLLTQAERAYSESESIRVVTSSNIHTSSFVTDRYTECATEIVYATINLTDLPEAVDKVDLVIIDEGHHEGCMTVQSQIHSRFGDCAQILLTATDKRLDGILIKYDAIIEPLTRQQAIESGYIQNSGIHSFVDYGGKEKSNLMADILSSYHHVAGQSLVFMRTQIEALRVDYFLREHLGISSIALTNQNPTEIDTILDDFGNGRYKFVVNCKRLGEGVDIPDVSDVFMGRHTTSYTILNQYIGRSVRLGSDSRVWNLIDPFSDRNLDVTEIITDPLYHKLYAMERGSWVERDIDVDSSMTA